MSDSPLKVYWDACTWISLIMGETQEGRATRCQHYLDEAAKGHYEIWTSSISHAEVYKRKCDGEQKAIAAEKDKNFEDFLEQEFVREVPLDHIIGSLARSLLRKYKGLKKPNDAIHLATAAFWNADELQTFDKDNLLDLDGVVKRRDGYQLKICEPQVPEGGAQGSLGLQHSVDDQLKNADSERRGDG